MFEKRWFMLDIARGGVIEKNEILVFLDGLERLGYNGLGIYIEASFAFENIPGKIKRDIMDPESARWMKEECQKRGMILFPLTNVVGHMANFFNQERFRSLKGKRHINKSWQIDFENPKAEEFAMKIIRDYAKGFDAKLVHIGGDEVFLTEETKPLYAQFLSKICNNMLNEGLQPAIWNDLIWMEPELSDYFAPEVFIFDWNYYGHRPESIEYFKSKGFKNIIVCPCDNAWEGFINYQRISGHLKARKDISIAKDEIEAFLEDACKAGVKNGFVTHWGDTDTCGQNLWAQWVPFTRAALYMCDKLQAREHNNKMIEEALFGKITPYTEITDILQEMQGENDEIKAFVLMRKALYNPVQLSDLISDCVEFSQKYIERFDEYLPKIENLLSTWKPESDFEILSCAAMREIVSMIRAARALLKTSNMKTLYSHAAKIQYIDTIGCKQELAHIKGAFDTAVIAVKEYEAIVKASIKITEHVREDILQLQKVQHLLGEVSNELTRTINESDIIPIPFWEHMLERVFLV